MVKFFKIVQLRPEVCPRGNDNCKSCRYHEGFSISSGCVLCSYDKQEKEEEV